ncbi:MAG: NHL repeat-containing protein [Planctomycetota bacterium]|jgi:streptogramin lyase
MKRTHFALFSLVVLISCSVFAVADTTEPDRDYRRAIIRPSLIRLKPGQRQKFKIVMSAPYLRPAYLAKKVKWSVNDIPGGNKKLGTIDSAGLYTAPAKAPKPHEIHICAEVKGANNRYLWATVLIGNPDPPYKLIRTWSEPKESPTYLDDPHGIGLDKYGNLLIADQGASRIMRFTPKGKFLGDIGLRSGNEPGHFNEPRVVITDARGRIWVSDSKPDGPILQSFTPEGKFIRIFAHKGVLPGQLLRAHGMGFDGKQRLFVVDVDNFRVNVYSDRGEFLYNWGKPGLQLGEFNAPHGLMVDPSDDVFVSNYFGPTQKFDPNGNLLFAFAYADPPDGPIGFHSISGDRWGNVYVTVRRGIVKYNNNGDYITAWRTDMDPSWIAVADDDTIYCLFKSGVQVFAPQ